MRSCQKKRKVEKLYKSLIGSLLYLTATRPDLIFAATILSSFMHSPGQVHMGAAKRVLRYVKGTNDYGILFEQREQRELIGYADNDWVGSVDDFRSTSDFVFSFGLGIFSWS